MTILLLNYSVTEINLRVSASPLLRILEYWNTQPINMEPELHQTKPNTNGKGGAVLVTHKSWLESALPADRQVTLSGKALCTQHPSNSLF